jgi:hypothetical protein
MPEVFPGAKPQMAQDEERGGMIWHAVGSLQRGIIDPPERIEIFPETEQAQDANALTIEELWRMQGYSAGYIRRYARRRAA